MTRLCVGAAFAGLQEPLGHFLEGGGARSRPLRLEGRRRQREGPRSAALSPAVWLTATVPQWKLTVRSHRAQRTKTTHWCELSSGSDRRPTRSTVRTGSSSSRRTTRTGTVSSADDRRTVVLRCTHLSRVTLDRPRGCNKMRGPAQVSWTPRNSPVRYGSTSTARRCPMRSWSRCRIPAIHTVAN